MGIGASLFLIAVGAVLRFAIYHQDISGVSLGTIGVILMIVGGLGLLVSLIALTARRRTDVVVQDRRYGEPPAYYR